MKHLLRITALTCTLSILSADQPSSEHFTLLQSAFHTGNDAAMPCISQNYQLKRSSLGDTSGPLIQGGDFQLLPGSFLGREDFLLLATTPENGAMEVESTTPLVLSFNREIQVGPGALRLYTSHDNMEVMTLPASVAIIQNSTASFFPAEGLQLQSALHILIDEDAFLDLDGLNFPGIDLGDIWSFTTRNHFSEVDASSLGLPAVRGASFDWGDFDKDGDFDLLLVGEVNSTDFARVYRNDGGSFTDIQAGLHPILGGQVHWIDYDMDRDLDIVLAGADVLANATRVLFYRNDDSLFVELDFGLTGGYAGSSDWADFDRDGDLDLLSCAYAFPGNFPVTNLYRNDGSTFTHVQNSLPDVLYGEARWIDADGDGDMDVLICGIDSVQDLTVVTDLYLYENGSFQAANAGFPQLAQGGFAIADFDNDGDEDFWLGGQMDDWESNFSSIFRNDGGVFTDLQIPMGPAYNTVADWGDLENDGDLDLLITGTRAGEGPDRYITRLYRNDDSSFTEMLVGPQGYSAGNEARGLGWCDLDSDHDLDFLFSGYYGQTDIFSYYRNEVPTANTAPQPPATLSGQPLAGGLQISWGPALDAETPSPGLSYNLYMTYAGAPGELAPVMADPATGLRHVQRKGNAGQGNSVTIGSSLAPVLLKHELADLYYGIQAIDHSFMGSPFILDTLEATLETVEFLELHNADPMTREDHLLWEPLGLELSEYYQLQISEELSFAAPLLDLNYVPVTREGNHEREGLLLSVTLAELPGSHNLADGTRYYWRLRPEYVDREFTTVFNDPPGSFLLQDVPQAPTDLQIEMLDGVVTLNWQPVPGNFVYYRIYSSDDAIGPFPLYWQEESPPTTDSSWADSLNLAARRFYRVTAVVVD